MKRKKSLTGQENKFGYFFTLPFIIGFIFIYSDMIVYSVVYSFSELKFNGSSFSIIPVGLENYKNIFTVNPDYVPTLVSSFGEMFSTVPVVLIFSLFVAVLLNRDMPGKTFFRAVFFIPVILMTGIIAKTDTSALVQSIMPAEGLGGGASTGSSFDLSNIESVLTSMSLKTDSVEYIVKFIDNIYSVVTSSGVQIILFLASLQSISPSVYEAAEVEGATGWETFWKITIPMIAPVILVCAVYTVIDLLSVSTNQIMQLIQSTTDNSGYGPAGAMAWSFFVLTAAVLGVIFVIGRKVVSAL